MALVVIAVELLVMESLQWGRMPHLFPLDHVAPSPAAVMVHGRSIYFELVSFVFLTISNLHFKVKV
jgi:hypothetical protein